MLATILLKVSLGRMSRMFFSWIVVCLRGSVRKKSVCFFSMSTAMQAAFLSISAVSAPLPAPMSRTVSVGASFARWIMNSMIVLSVM